MQHPPHPDAPINPITIMLAPELAVLAVLDELVTITTFALCAAHPRLTDPDPPGPELPIVQAAHHLIESLHQSRLACSRYRRAALRDLLDEKRRDNIPF